MKTPLTLLAALALALAGCSGPSATDAPVFNAGAKTESAGDDGAPSGGATNSSPASPRGLNLTPASTTRSDAPRRAVIRNGSLAVRVGNLEKAERAAGSIIARLGGYVDSADSTDLAGKKPILTLTARIPERSFEQALREFESLGTRLSKRIAAQDVTAEIADHAARLSTMRAHEESLRTILRQAKDSSSMMEAQQRLSEARGEIEALEARLSSVRGLATLSTVELRLEQSAEALTGEDPRWAAEAWAAATSSAERAYHGVASLAMWAIVYSPLWVLGYLGFRGIRRHLAQTSPTASL